MSEPIEREYLVRAYERMRHTDWGTLDEALAHPVRGGLIHGMARSLQRMALHPTAENPPKPRPFSSPARGFQGGTLDRKRLASGEKDDDE